MKKTMYTVLAAGFLAVLAGCASMNNQYFDERTTAFLPDSTVQWAVSVDQLAAPHEDPNSHYSKKDPERRGKLQRYIAYIARSPQEELEQQGIKVSVNLNADRNPLYQRLEQCFRALPPGTVLVWGGLNPGDSVPAAAFLADDGTFMRYVPFF
jgi:hypothetical protein